MIPVAEAPTPTPSHDRRVRRLDHRLDLISGIRGEQYGSAVGFSAYVHLAFAEPGDTSAESLMQPVFANASLRGVLNLQGFLIIMIMTIILVSEYARAPRQQPDGCGEDYGNSCFVSPRPLIEVEKWSHHAQRLAGSAHRGAIVFLPTSDSTRSRRPRRSAKPPARQSPSPLSHRSLCAPRSTSWWRWCSPESSTGRRSATPRRWRTPATPWVSNSVLRWVTSARSPA